MHQYRYKIILIVFVLASIVLLLKAMQIQLLDTSYQRRAAATAIDVNVKYPSRGLIFDRNEKLLVNNNPMYDLMVTYNQIDPDMDTLKFCKLLNIDKSTFEKNLDKKWGRRYRKYIPFDFLKKISAENYAQFQEYLHEFPGFFIQLRNVRGYPHTSAAHVLGYISEVNQQQIDASNGKYALRDYLGASGLEKKYEDYLKGKKGIEYLLKDNLGREVGPYSKGTRDSSAISGHDLICSIDLDLQAYGEKLMQNKRGSIVAIEPQTGEILAMVSTPTYDPNLLAIHRDRGEAFNALLSDTINKPFFDRTVMAKYPPGSVFKTIVSLVALQEGVSNANRYITCNGAYYYKNVPYGCHEHTSCSSIAKALQVSCNTYYFTLIRDIIDMNGFHNPDKGLDKFVEYLYSFGLGKPLGVDIPNEGKGNIPTTAYYDYLYPKVRGSWRSPTVMSIGIGQGEIQMTTLQIANLAAIIANKGYFYPPHLSKGFRNNTTEIPAKYKVKKEVPIDEEYFYPVIDGMARCVNAGTGYSAKVPDIEVCGKTGTSQNPHGKDHSVFFAFAPKEDPKIAIAVYVENGGFGSTYASPIAGLMIEQYLKGEVDPVKAHVEDRIFNANLVGIPNL